MLEKISSPADIRDLSHEQLATLASEIRTFIVNAVSVTGGHLGSNLGVVELTFALHRVFDSPRDILLWDTGHQAYVHKILTGRRERFTELRQPGGLSGYPSRAESEHDWVENSHASTILSYAHGVATSLRLSGAEDDRRVVAVIGDGSMTGGMAYEALNNLGHSGRKVLIVLNDNGRSYAPTISRLSTSVTRLRSSPSYVRRREMAEGALREVPVVGEYLQAGVGEAADLGDVPQRPLDAGAPPFDPRVEAQPGEAVGQTGHGRGVGAAVVVEDDHHPPAGVAQVVERLVGHAAGHGAVADDGHHLAVRCVPLDRLGQAVGVGEDRRGVAVLDPVVDRLGPRRVPGEPAPLAQGAEHLLAAGEDLVHVGLVAGVPQQDVPGGGEDPVQGDGQLDRPEVRPQVAAGHRYRLHDEAAELGGQLPEFFVAQPGQ
ncbi:MAG: hypothetical protein JO050_07005, partial [Acidimicrobiia bacterium]|nr:hypothetical protein [Acidimicrobiia bacterium]